MHRIFRHGNRGSVLIVVIWIALGLAAVVLYFANTVFMEYRAADQAQAGLESEQAIEGARRYLTYALKNQTTKGVIPSLDDGDYLAQEIPIGEAQFSLIGRDATVDTYPTEPVYGLVDEASKLSLNTATLEMLESLPGMDADVAAAIIDWRDADDEVNAGGAESQDYLMLEKPYNAKNSDFETPEELRLVMNMNMALLLGEDANRNGVLDANENDGNASPPDDDGDGILDPGILEYVTTFTREPGADSSGGQKISLTKASGLSSTNLQQVLNKMSDQGRAQQIYQATRSRASAMHSPLELYMICREIAQMTPQEFQEIEGSLLNQNGSGLVNVTTASSTVLTALLEGDSATASQLTSARGGLDSTALQSVAWVGDAVTPEIAAQIGPYITAHSYQYSADICATGHEKRGFRREWIVFDTEESEPKVIYRRDLTRYGWPLGENNRATSNAQAAK